MITQKILMEHLLYNPETGVFTYRKSKNPSKIGKVAGYQRLAMSGISYVVFRICGEVILAHRAAVLYVVGELPPKGMQIDHIDGNGTNNAWANLRVVRQQENLKNKRLYRKSTTGIPGVTWEKDRGLWLAQIGVNGRCVKIGRFESINDAAVARRKAEIKLGYHENHGSTRAAA